MPPRKTARTEAMADLSFEEALAQLEALVAEVESGEIPLEKALAASERGAELAARCRQLLDIAEKRLIELKADATGRLRPSAPEAEAST